MTKPRNARQARLSADSMHVRAIGSKIQITDGMRRQEAALNEDSFINTITGVGVRGRDATRGGRQDWKQMSEQEAEDIYAGTGLARRICDKLPGDALKKWVEYKDFDNLQEVKDADRRLGIRHHLKRACSWGRMYGRAHIFMNTGEPPEQWEKPLDLGAVRELKSLLLLSRWELTVDGSDIENDIDSDRFGQPRCYRLSPHRVTMPRKGQLFRIHHSRLLDFHGAPLGLRRWITNVFSHDSVFNGLTDALTDYIQSNRGVAVAMNRFREETHYIKNLAQDIAAGQKKAIQKRVSDISAVMSILGVRVLDMDNEKQEFFQNTFAGVPEVLEGMKETLAANTEYPKIVLFNESPEGSMGGNGSSELEGYYNTVGEFQEDNVRPQLDRYYDVLFASKTGPTRGQAPEDWSYTFPPVWQASEQERAATELAEAQADDLRLQQGVLDEIDIIEMRYPEKADKMTDQDKNAMREAMAQEKQARAEQMAQALAQGGPVVQPKDRPAPKDDPKKPGNKGAK